MGATAEIGDGVLDGNHFYHTMKMKTPMGNMKIKVDGKLEGDMISGTLKAMMITMPFKGKRMEQK